MMAFTYVHGHVNLSHYVSCVEGCCDGTGVRGSFMDFILLLCSMWNQEEF